MPVFGRLDVAPVLATAPVVELSPEPWELPEAQLLQLTFEVADEPALELVPPALHPSIPPYAALNVARFPDTPVGPFALAQVRLVCRAGIRPRGYLLGAVCDSARAAEALAVGWGFKVRVGEVGLSVRHDRVRAQVAFEGRTVLDAGLALPEPLGSGDLQPLASLNLARLSPDDRTGALIQVDPEYAVHTADRGRPVVTAFAAEHWGGEDLLQLRNPIVAWSARADTDLPVVRFAIDPNRPAFEGTRRVDRAAA